jgi:formate hydrogenlyase transcriptional activator
MPKSVNIDFEKEIHLSHLTMEALHEGVLWTDAAGKIILTNEAVIQLTGYDKEKLRTLSIFNIFPSFTKADYEYLWDKLKKGEKVVQEIPLKHNAGYIKNIEIAGSYSKVNDDEFLCCVISEISRLQVEEDLLRMVSEATSGYVGQDYFRELAKFITVTLNVKYSLVSECVNEEKTKLRTIAYVEDASLKENIEYDVSGTPCEIVINGKDYFCSDELEKLFPKERGKKSYIAVPIYSPASGEIIGHIAALDDKPMDPSHNQTSILKIFAARAGSEIERIKTEQKLKEALEDANVQLQQQLKESEERFRDLFDEAPIAYVNEGLDSKFINANKTALKTLGITEADIPSTYGFSFIPNTPDAQQRLKSAFESIGKGIDTKGVVLELRKKNTGAPLWIQWWSRPDPNGQSTRTMFLDITDQVMMEQEKVKLQAQNKYLQEEIKLTHNFEEIISKSKIFHKVLQQIEQVATTDATVLILGESGTGKELIARAIHNISNRSKQPLVKVNCATLPANLIESELFGHEKGAFTGAMERKIGRFELADSGTIFLDEIGELPIELQAKLLRVLQEGEFERLGNPKTMKVNVRIIAATNRNLNQAIEKKEFREDLYYRLNVFPILCPPLRERKEDIPLLVKHFCKKHEGKIGKSINNVTDNVVEALTEYNWPGNIRELENIIERAMILSRDGVLDYGDWVPSHIETTNNDGQNRIMKMEDVEKDHIIAVLKQTNWRVSGEKGAAKILGLNPTTLEARMKKLGIVREKV